MNLDIEQRVINAFINKDRRKRAIFELTVKNRDRYLFKMEWELDPRYARIIKPPVASYEDVLNELRRCGVPNQCYVMARDQDFDGKEMDLVYALQSKVFRGPVLISCIHGELAYYEGEQDVAATRYILSR